MNNNIPYSCPQIKECEYSTQAIHSLIREIKSSYDIQLIHAVIDKIYVETLTIEMNLDTIRQINNQLRSALSEKK